MRLTEWRQEIPPLDLPAKVYTFRMLNQLKFSPMGTSLSFLLPFVVIGGAVLFLLGRLFGIQLSHSLLKTVVAFYGLFSIAYVVWYSHLFLGLPIFFSLEREFGILLSAGSALIFLIVLLRYFLHHQKIRGIHKHRLCPHCHQGIITAISICPYCKEFL
jgi:hypothetical protein